MKPNEPHSFTPRNPATADGRTTCICGLPADAEPHLRAMLVESVKLMSKAKMCSKLGCSNKAHSKRLCRTHLGREVVMSTTVPAEMAAQVRSAAKGAGVRPSRWIREALFVALAAERLGKPHQSISPTAGGCLQSSLQAQQPPRP